MKSEKLVLWVALGLGVLLLAGSGSMLVIGFSGYNESMKEMIGSKDKIKRIYSDSDPFPTKENIAVYEENGVELKKWFNEIFTSLAANQVEPVQKSPSAFMASLGEKRTQLHKLINDNGVKMPQNFDLGFKKYFMSSAPLPAPMDVGRLGQQLHLIERLLTIFIEAQPDEIIGIRREIFEGAQLGVEEEDTTTSRRRGRSSRDDRDSEENVLQGMDNKNTGKIGKNEIFGKMYFEFVIKAKMESALKILNNLAKEDMFLRVSSVTFKKPTNGILPAKTIEANAIKDGVALTELSRPERLVSGMELEDPMDVTIGIEVYRFDTKYIQQDR
jgi:hypothetical protein